jgi:hypothetical protein
VTERTQSEAIRANTAVTLLSSFPSPDDQSHVDQTSHALFCFPQSEMRMLTFLTSTGAIVK